jgi:hypothetical protein
MEASLARAGAPRSPTFHLATATVLNGGFAALCATNFPLVELSQPGVEH